MEEKHLKILVATDYSDAATDAEQYAVQLAKSINATLLFFHLYKVPGNSPADRMAFAKIANELHQSEVERLNQHVDKLLVSSGVKTELAYECIVRKSGNAEKEIIEEAEESDVDFIVVGTHGLSGFRKLFFGSRAWSVIKKSGRPVFAIPQGAVFKGIRKIAFGTEYRNGEIPGLNFLLRFAKLFEAEVTVLHITNYILSKSFEREMFENFKNDVINKMPYPNLKMHLMVSENVSDGVDKFCVKNKTDLLVMSPKKPFIFDNYFMTNMSMTRKTIFHTRTPLLAIPDFYASKDAEYRELFEVGSFVNSENK